MKELVGIAEQIAARLVARKETIAVAESSTGGLIAAALLAVPGASAYFKGGAVVYTREARRLLMDIPDEAMKGIRSASEAYAKLLAEQMRRRFETDWGISETGATSRMICSTTSRLASFICRWLIRERHSRIATTGSPPPSSRCPVSRQSPISVSSSTFSISHTASMYVPVS